MPATSFPALSPVVTIDPPRTPAGARSGAESTSGLPYLPSAARRRHCLGGARETSRWLVPARRG